MTLLYYLITINTITFITYGIDKFLELYKQKEISSTTQQIYGLTTKELDEKFVAYVKMFFLDPEIESLLTKLIEHLA